MEGGLYQWETSQWIGANIVKHLSWEKWPRTSRWSQQFLLLLFPPESSHQLFSHSQLSHPPTHPDSQLSSSSFQSHSLPVRFYWNSPIQGRPWGQRQQQTTALSWVTKKSQGSVRDKNQSKEHGLPRLRVYYPNWKRKLDYSGIFQIYNSRTNQSTSA